MVFQLFGIGTRGIDRGRKTEAMKTWPKTKSVREIQVFISFAKSYQRFINGFNKIAIVLILMLKAILTALDSASNEKGSGIKPDVIKINFFKTDFHISKAQIVFILLSKAFTKALILHHLDLERHIDIETDVSAMPLV